MKSTMIRALVAIAAMWDDGMRRRRISPAGLHDATSCQRRHDDGPGELRDVVLVGNNWAGTVNVFDP